MTIYEIKNKNKSGNGMHVGCLLVVFLSSKSCISLSVITIDNSNLFVGICLELLHFFYPAIPAGFSNRNFQDTN